VTQDVLESRPAAISVAEAQALAQTLYGLTVEARALTSERDQNFRLRAADGAQYVLKITNAAEDPAVSEMQALAFMHVAAADEGLPTPRLILTRSGKLMGVHRAPEGDRSVRLLTFLDGVLLHAARPTAAQRRSLGAAHARLGLALRGFAHPAQDHVLLWDLKQAAGLRKLLPHVTEPTRRAQAQQALDAFDARVAPQLPGLRWQVVHNDLNPHNVVVAPDDTDRVSGILDFGDMVHAPLVCDVAIAASYQLGGAGLAGLCDYAGAYAAVTPLEAAELDLLYDLMAMRMATSVLISEWRAALYPENAEYILRNHPTAVKGLADLAGLGREAFDAAVRAACDPETRP
jgi:Ser/Thr protein kinase RdoA (MazF antagonist)